MGRKGKRRKRRPSQGSSGAPSQAREARVLPPPEEGGSSGAAPPARAGDRGGRRRPAEEPRRPRGFFAAVPSPYPPLAESLAAGARPVTGSVPILVTAFLLVLVVWLIFALLGGEPSPRVMVVFGALPPISTFFDAILTSSLVQGAVTALSLIVAVTLARSVALVVILTRIHRGVAAEDGGAPPGPARSAHLRIGGSLFAIQAAELAFVLAIPILLQGFLGPQISVLATWIVGLYFLGMAPVVVAVESVSAAEGLRRSFRAARLPGYRHTALVMMYFALVLWVTSITPVGAVPSATPDLVAWLITLGFTVVHLVFFAALTYRWLRVRDQVAAGPRARGEREG